jgi:hypothetical protein
MFSELLLFSIKALSQTILSLKLTPVPRHHVMKVYNYKWSASVVVVYLLPFEGKLNGSRTDLCFVTERDFPVSCREWWPDRLTSNKWYTASIWSFLFALEIYLWGRTKIWELKRLQKSVATVTKWRVTEVSVICEINDDSVSVTRAWISLCKSVQLEISWQDSSLLWGVVSSTLNPDTGGPPNVCCLLLLIQYIRNCLPHVEAVLSISNPRKRHAVTTVDPPNMEFKSSAWISPEPISEYHCRNNFNRLVHSNHILINRM